MIVVCVSPGFAWEFLDARHVLAPRPLRFLGEWPRLLRLWCVHSLPSVVNTLHIASDAAGFRLSSASTQKKAQTHSPCLLSAFPSFTWVHFVLCGLLPCWSVSRLVLSF